MKHTKALVITNIWAGRAGLSGVHKYLYIERGSLSVLCWFPLDQQTKEVEIEKKAEKQEKEMEKKTEKQEDEMEKKAEKTSFINCS